MITTQTADSVLKSYYLGVVSDQLDKTVNPLLAEIKKTASDVWGRDVRKAVRFGVSGGVGAGTEDGDLPKALSSGYAQFVAPLKNLYGTIEVSDKAIRASENNEGAFVNLLNDEMGSLVRSSAFNFSRMLFGDGSGKLASITAIPSTGDTEYTVDSAINLAEGMVVDIYSADTRDTAGAVIASVDRATNKIAFEGTVSNVAADDVIYMQNSKDLEITGLKAIFEAEELYGITRTGKSWLTPYTKSSFGAMSEDALQEAIDGVEEYGGGKVNFIVCSRGVRRKLITAHPRRRRPFLPQGHDVSSQHRRLRSPSAVRLAVAGGRGRQDLEADPRQARLYGDARQVRRAHVLSSRRAGDAHGHHRITRRAGDDGQRSFGACRRTSCKGRPSKAARGAF